MHQVNRVFAGDGKPNAIGERGKNKPGVRHKQQRLFADAWLEALAPGVAGVVFFGFVDVIPHAVAQLGPVSFQ